MGDGVEHVGFMQFTATESGVQGLDDLSGVDQCQASALQLLRGINTRPGDDEEVLIQVIVRKKPNRGIREAISRRIDQ